MSARVSGIYDISRSTWQYGRIRSSSAHLPGGGYDLRTGNSQLLSLIFYVNLSLSFAKYGFTTPRERRRIFLRVNGRATSIRGRDIHRHPVHFAVVARSRGL